MIRERVRSTFDASWLNVSRRIGRRSARGGVCGVAGKMGRDSEIPTFSVHISFTTALSPTFSPISAKMTSYSHYRPIWISRKRPFSQSCQTKTVMGYSCESWKPNQSNIFTITIHRIQHPTYHTMIIRDERWSFRMTQWLNLAAHCDNIGGYWYICRLTA